jgi:hypothetical protein
MDFVVFLLSRIPSWELDLIDDNRAGARRKAL